jgi:glycine cleavage system aminomethyltransferase T
MPSDGLLLSKLRPLAERVGGRDGHQVPLRYGSVAAELAACMRSVGLVDREDLRVSRIEAEAAALDRISANRFATELRPGQALSVGGAHWGRTSAEEIITVCPAASAALLLERLRNELETDVHRVAECPLATIEAIGPATAKLLADLDAYGALASPNGTGVVGATPVASGEVTWMLLDDAWALAIVDRAHAVATWEEIAAAGRRHGLCYVGTEAAERFELVHRRSGERAHR